MRHAAIAGWRVDSRQVKEAAREAVLACGARPPAAPRATRSRCPRKADKTVKKHVVCQCTKTEGTPPPCLTRCVRTRVKVVRYSFPTSARWRRARPSRRLLSRPSCRLRMRFAEPAWRPWSGCTRLQSQATWFQWFCLDLLDFAHVASDCFELPSATSVAVLHSSWHVVSSSPDDPLLPRLSLQHVGHHG